ncbi:hypothetical protein SLS62_005322 [Diatrype stigma]|uniref:Ankyrin repeat protein n=1 Tax=Diatrype stigma TaxID=117547 RepID=A0AAN9UV62_9PEZI
MGIHEDAAAGSLVGPRLVNYIKNGPNVLNEQDPVGGLTPLAAATVRGYVKVVEQLLRKGAKADALSSNGESPLLLAAWKAKNNRARIIQLLLGKTPSDSVDATCPSAENYTPLMWTIMNKDIESIRLLRRAGASLEVQNDDGINAEEMAEEVEDMAVSRALRLDEPSLLSKLASAVVYFLLFIIAWLNRAKGAVRRVFGLNPKLDEDLNQNVNGSSNPGTAKFVENVDKFVKNGPLERFFGGKKDYIKELAQKTADLENDPTTPLGNRELLPKTIKVSLHQQVLYCDDSSSMKRDGRWDSQRKLVERITRITTRILPEGEGVALRFINQDVNTSLNLTLTEIGEILAPLSWKSGGNTQIGTNLRSKILEPLVYSKIETKSLERPLLVTIITDGIPSEEKNSEFVDAILECGSKLGGAGYPRDSTCSFPVLFVPALV